MATKRRTTGTRKSAARPKTAKKTAGKKKTAKKARKTVHAPFEPFEPVGHAGGRSRKIGATKKTRSKKNAQGFTFQPTPWLHEGGPGIKGGAKRKTSRSGAAKKKNAPPVTFQPPKHRKP